MLEVLRRATGYLEQHGSGSPRLDAELLMAHVLGLRRLDLYLQFERPLSDPELAPYRELIARRGRGEPVAYLVGRKEFMKLDFEVTPEVVVPNPDTEPLVLRDMARVCASCVRKAQCNHDLDAGASPEQYADYCLNAGTIEALEAVAAAADAKTSS